MQIRKLSKTSCDLTIIELTLSPVEVSSNNLLPPTSHKLNWIKTSNVLAKCIVRCLTSSFPSVVHTSTCTCTCMLNQVNATTYTVQRSGAMLLALSHKLLWVAGSRCPPNQSKINTNDQPVATRLQTRYENNTCRLAPPSRHA